MLNLLALICLSATAAGSAPEREMLTLPAVCVEPATGKQFVVPTSRVQKDLAKAQQTMREKGIFVVDLPESAQQARTRLDKELADKAWCLVRADVQSIQDAVDKLKSDPAFLSHKIDREERSAGQAQLSPGETAAVTRLLNEARTKLSAGQAPAANHALNRILLIILRLADAWQNPNAGEASEPALVATPNEPVSFEPEEIEQGCPNLPAAADAAQYANARGKIAEWMDAKQLRPLDARDGERLVDEIRTQLNAKAYLAATQRLCVLWARLAWVRVDLGFVMGRFRFFDRMQMNKKIPEAKKAIFRELTEAVSKDMGRREFVLAHTSTERILVLLGEPEQPSMTLP